MVIIFFFSLFSFSSSLSAPPCIKKIKFGSSFFFSLNYTYLTVKRKIRKCCIYPQTHTPSQLRTYAFLFFPFNTRSSHHCLKKPLFLSSNRLYKLSLLYKVFAPHWKNLLSLFFYPSVILLHLHIFCCLTVVSLSYLFFFYLFTFSNVR